MEFEILNKAIEVLRNYPLCDRCLGRLFAQLGRGLSNKERGRAIKLAILMEIHRALMEGKDISDYLDVLKNLGSIAKPIVKMYKLNIEPVDQCYICGCRIDEMISRGIQKVCELIKEHGFSSFLVGVVPPSDMVSKEKELVKQFQLSFWESIRSELKREIGKGVRDTIGINPKFEDPDVTFVIDFEHDTVTLEIPSLLILGTYWKLGRRISQVPWIRRDGSRKYPLSIEDVLQKVLELTGGTRAIFHGAGREDVDVRMLGSGRPFVLEVAKPKRRDVAIEEIEKILNDVTPWVKFRLEMKVKRDIISKIKTSGSHSYKIYRALIVTKDPIDQNKLKTLEEFFKDRVVSQRTPTRVLRRRKDLLRRRRVIEVKTLQIADNVFEALIKCEGGLYIKELVNGDQGRTTPSFAEVLGTDAVCVELDVVYVQKYL